MSAEHETRTVVKLLAAVALGSAVTVREPYRLADEMAERLHETGLLMSPERAVEARAEGLGAAADHVDAYLIPSPASDIDEHVNDVLSRLTEELREQAEEGGAGRDVYLASHADGIRLGIYTNPGAARAHCEALVRREQPDPALSLEWLPDDEDDPAVWELLTYEDGAVAETTTGYRVTAIDVASSYDEEADE